MTEDTPAPAVAAFVDLLIRDHLPAGAVEKLIESIEANGCRRPHDHLAAHACDLARRLTQPQDDWFPS